MERKTASSSFGTSETKSMDYIKMAMNPITVAPTTQPPLQYQPRALQMGQHSRDSDIAKQMQIESDYELVDIPMANVHTQQLPSVYQSLEQAQKNEIYQGLSTGGAGRDDTKAVDSVKKMKIILLVTVTVNIAMLLLVIAAAILCGSLIQSKFEQVMSRQHLSMSQINELTAMTNESISQISMQLQQTNNNISSELNAANKDIGDLTALTYYNISLISTQLTATNDNITSALNQLDTNLGYISNIVTELTKRQLQLYCGPGEWRQVAYLNMSDSSQQCPSPWREYNTSSVRACGRPLTSGGSCVGVSYSNNNEQYSRVCGRAVGYQFGGTDGFGYFARGRTIDSYYVFGVSFTHGSPRTHIWTLAAGLSENGIDHAPSNCPCTTPSGQVAPSFVGSDFYCESGNPTDSHFGSRLLSEDPLWDGEKCEGECCSNGKSPPWFSVELPNPTSDNVEVRICCPESTYNDIPIQLLEIYVQ